MKLTTAKAMFAKVATAALLAGAVVMAAPQTAQAQVNFGISFGRPVYAQPYVRPYYAPRYVAPPVYGYGYVAPRVYGYNRYEVERRNAFIRHEEWDRAHYGYHSYYGR